MIWPVTGTGERLASLLREATNAGSNALNGTGDQIIVNYLEWVNAQVRMLQNVLAPHDVDRLLTPRYWATFDNQVPSTTAVNAVQEEVQHRVRMLMAAADAVAAEMKAWTPRGEYTDFVVPDTNFWINEQDSLSTFDWHALLDQIDGTSYASGEEIRIVVPMLVIDELDGLSHRADKRAKVAAVTKFLYGVLGQDPGSTQQLLPAVGKKETTIQLLFEPLGHVRLPNSDDELVERVLGLRDFLGHSGRRTFFVTYDGGAAFRATNAGLMTRHLETPTR